MSASGQVPVPRNDIFLDAGGCLGPLKTNQLLVNKKGMTWDDIFSLALISGGCNQFDTLWMMGR
jgi:hypothetical protein